VIAWKKGDAWPAGTAIKLHPIWGRIAFFQGSKPVGAHVWGWYAENPD